MINDAESFVLGPITVENVSRNIDFDPGFIPGDKIRVLLIEAQNEIEKSNLVISRVGHIVYDFFGVRKTVFEGRSNCYGFDCSSSCLENIVCFPDFNDESRAVALITYTDPLDEFNNIGIHGTGYLINNGFQDKRPLFLSMIHGIAGYMTPDLKLIFHYKSPQCNNSIEGPVAYFVQGAIPLVLDPSNDLRLIELQTNPGTSQIFSTNPVSYLGWSIIDEPITKTYGVHHPKGDVQKYMEGGLAIPIVEPGTSYNVWKYNLNNGFPETNSSGSPTFNQFKRVIGSLRSAEQVLTCSNFQNIDTYSVRISKSWPVLCQFLDPGNEGIVAMNTLIDNPVDKVFSSISGPDYLCSTSSFNLINAPLDLPVAWTVSPTHLFSGSTSGSSSSAPLSPSGSTASGQATITFAIDTDCGEVEVQQSFWVGKARADIIGPYDMPTNTVEAYYAEGFFPYTGMLHLMGITDYQWSVYPSGYDWIYGQGMPGITLTISFPGFYSLGLDVTNPCGVMGTEMPVHVYNPWEHFTLYPNPTSDILQISMDLETRGRGGDQDFEVSLYDGQGRELIPAKLAHQQTSLDLSRIPKGFYYVHIRYRDALLRRQIRVER
ncbi:T9SS type A sorting domain-containing protein [Aquiflexum balticum]|uniref:T9SS type A sorting domain-containing protein n=1 Tax=Aquiflexum balticum TaxID=280473 RepID=UPI001560ED09|nr:T9SS type A sorting domain-containing protein [Aquiflexum balticum]